MRNELNNHNSSTERKEFASTFIKRYPFDKGDNLIRRVSLSIIVLIFLLIYFSLNYAGIYDFRFQDVPSDRIHIVKKGETLTSISKKYTEELDTITPAILKKLNRNIKGDIIYVGQKLIIRKGNSRSFSGATHRKPKQQTNLVGTTEQPNKEHVQKILENRKSASYEGYKIHKVKEKETLFRIAQKYGMSIDEIKEINQLKGDNIIIGHVLKVGYRSSNKRGRIAIRNTSGDFRDFSDYSEDMKRSPRFKDSYNDNLYDASYDRSYGSSNGSSSPSTNYDRNYSSTRPAKYKPTRQGSNKSSYASSNKPYNSRPPTNYNSIQNNLTDFEWEVYARTEPEVLDIIDRLNDKIIDNRIRKENRQNRNVSRERNDGESRLNAYRSIPNQNFRRSGNNSQRLSNFREQSRKGRSVYYYRVKKGDSMTSIAIDQGTTSQEIIDENDLRGTDLRVGRILKIIK